MSGQVEVSGIESSGLETRPPGSLARSWWALVRRVLEPAADRLNPILVKEARQALKSRQFVITFSLLLLCGWFWSIGGVAMIGPDIYYSAQGAEMFVGYYFILAFPLLVIVPFGAFRSLAGEKEDRTYELLSITGLGPRQIISGKLASASLQMVIYLSAISPCLAFTYLLGGIALPTILFVLCWTVLASLGLSLIGLLVGTSTAEKHWQSVLSVLLILGLIYGFGLACAFATVTVSEAWLSFTSAEFWQANAAVLTAYATTFALAFLAASAQLLFASENRSTGLRVAMLVQHLAFTGWMGWIFVTAVFEMEFLAVYLMMGAMYWDAMGSVMTGESPELSPRVRRSLPQSFLGRVFLTWFNPGPATGYIYALSGLLSGTLMVSIALVVMSVVGIHPSNFTPLTMDEMGALLCFAVLALCYTTFYLGLGLLLLRLLRKVTKVGLLLAALIQILLLLAFCAMPLVIQLSTPQLRSADYTLLQITNAFWTLSHLIDQSSLPTQAPVLLVVVPSAAALVFLLNLPGIVREVRAVRIAKPGRVAEEDAQLAAQKAPPQPIRTSPWDD